MCSDFGYMMQAGMVANMATDECGRGRYNRAMPKAPKYKNPPLQPMNQWVRDALAHAGMTFPQLADALTRSGVGTYDRSTIQKMTVGRKVSFEEARAISEATGYPYVSDEDGQGFVADYLSLDPESQATVRDLLQVLRSRHRAGGA